MKDNTFRIYPNDESETDRLVTKALVLGDFESAVSLCLSSDRFADAILLAVKGGPELLARTQKAYFERRTTAFPYLRLFQSIVTDDLDEAVDRLLAATPPEVRNGTTLAFLDLNRVTGRLDRLIRHRDGAADDGPR